MRRNVYLYEYANVPFDFAHQVLLERPQLLVDAGLDGALKRGEEVATNLVADLGSLHLEREVTVAFGDFWMPQGAGRVCYRQLTWRASESKGLFPAMEAELEAFELADAQIQLSLIGSYRPPGGVLGGMVDALVMQKVADAALHELLQRAVESLELAWADQPQLLAD